MLPVWLLLQVGWWPSVPWQPQGWPRCKLVPVPWGTAALLRSQKPVEGFGGDSAVGVG